MGLVTGDLALDDHIAQHILVLVFLPGEGLMCEMAHGAVGAIASDEPGRVDGLLASVGVTERGADTVRMLHERQQLRLPLHRDAQTIQQGFEDRLGPALLEGERERVR